MTKLNENQAFINEIVDIVELSFDVKNVTYVNVDTDTKNDDGTSELDIVIFTGFHGEEQQYNADELAELMYCDSFGLREVADTVVTGWYNEALASVEVA